MGANLQLLNITTCDVLPVKMGFSVQHGIGPSETRLVSCHSRDVWGRHSLGGGHGRGV